MKQTLLLEQGQLAALKKRLASGRPLTAAQMAFVYRFSAGGKDTGAGESDTAAGVSALARRLGVSRQLVTAHRGLPDAPRTFSVSAWRNYFRLHGRDATIARIESAVPIAAGTERPNPRVTYAEGVGGLLDKIGNRLRVILAVALDDAGFPKPTTEQLDKSTLIAWRLFAALADDMVTRWGFESIYTPVQLDDEDAPHWAPSEIEKIAKRLGEKITPPDANH